MSIILDGSSQYGYKAGISSISYPVSIGAWIKADNTTTSGVVASLENHSNADYNILQPAGTLTGDPVRAGTYNTAWCTADSTSGYTSGSWIHVLAVFASATDRRVYLNGSNKGTNATSQTAAIANLVVGAYKYGGVSGYFDGKIAHVGIWDTALGDADAAALAAGTWTTAVQNANLVHLYTFLADANDSVGNDHLTLVGSPSYDSDNPTLYVDIAASGGGTGGGTGTLTAELPTVDIAASGGGVGGGTAVLDLYIPDLHRPVELYTITRGTTIWRLNNSVKTVVCGAYTFYPQAGLRRGEITDGMESLDFYLPADHAYPAAYQSASPKTPTTVTIQYYEIDDSESLRVMYKGWVKGVGLEEDNQVAKIHLDPICVGLSSEIPMDTFSAQCQTAIFSTRCGLTTTGHTFTATVSAVSGDTITVPGLEAAKGSTFANCGIVTFGDDARQVFKQEGDVLTLSIAFYGAVLGEEVVVYEGCDGRIETCELKGNADNFRGFPYVPTTNPFVTGLQ